jgi:hypothetical protein
VRLPPRLRVGERIILLNHDTRLFSDPLANDRDFDEPIAKVSQKPDDPSVWGPRNLTQDKWTFTRPDGTTADVPLEVVGTGMVQRANLFLNCGSFLFSSAVANDANGIAYKVVRDWEGCHQGAGVVGRQG